MQKYCFFLIYANFFKEKEKKLFSLNISFEKLDLEEMKIDFKESSSNVFEDDLFKIKLR